VSSSRPGTESRDRRAAVEATVLEATERLLEQGRSFAELRVEEIATAAGMSRPAFYFYFRDKRDLLVRLTADVTDLLFAQAEHWWDGEGDGAAELEEALRAMLVLYREHAGILRAVVEAAATDEEVAAFWRGLVGRFAERSRARIEAEQAAGHAPADLPAAATAFALCWMVERSAYQLIAQDTGLADDEVTRALTGAWTRAVYSRT
jgi:TetR/AcrR family transcriptional regulator, ethionamide resistance regulator